LKRDGERIVDIVATYPPSTIYAVPLDYKQMRKMIKTLKSGYDSTFHSHPFSHILSRGDEVDFLSMGYQLMVIVGGTYKKLIYI